MREVEVGPRWFWSRYCMQLKLVSAKHTPFRHIRNKADILVSDLIRLSPLIIHHRGISCQGREDPMQVYV